MQNMSSYIEISQSALKQNHRFIQSVLKPNVKLSSVLKGNAYGHGIEVMVPLVEDLGVDHIAVFSGEEAMRVKKVCAEKTDIMVMGMLTDNQLFWAIDNDIEFYVFDLSRLEKTIGYATANHKTVKIHLEIETGMNRTGLSKDEFICALDMIDKHKKNLTLYGICTHLAGAESIINYYRIQNQIEFFDEISCLLEQKKIQPKYKHISCSAGTLRYPETQMDLVRIGILQYGFFPTKEVMVNYFTENDLVDDPLKRVLSWKSQIMSLKTVKKGEYIGYSTAYMATKDMTIAVIPIGYGSGFARSLTNQGKVIIRGKYAPVVGIVNMNSISVDVTEISNVSLGDKVTIIGKDGELDITIASFSDISNQVNYELLTRLPGDIPRILVD